MPHNSNLHTKMAYKTIIIGRQFGAGGRELGELLSDRLGIPYYDRTLLKEAANRLGFDRRLFDNADEKKPSLMRAFFATGLNDTYSDYSVSSLNREKIYAAQCDVIRQLAEESPCIFIGRTADYVTREMESRLSIFLHAELDDRIRRILSRMDCKCHKEAREFALKRDKMRREYYNYFTGRNWGDAANYDMTFNTSLISIPQIAQIITELSEAQQL